MRPVEGHRDRIADCPRCGREIPWNEWTYIDYRKAAHVCHACGIVFYEGTP